MPVSGKNLFTLKISFLNNYMSASLESDLQASEENVHFAQSLDNLSTIVFPLEIEIKN